MGGARSVRRTGSHTTSTRQPPRPRLTTGAATVKADKASIESARAQIVSQEAAVNNARVALSYTIIRSPLDGRTGSLMVHAGNLVKANDPTPLVVINQVSRIYVTFGIPEAIFTEAALSFIGVGINPPTPSWGQMVGEGQQYLRSSWHLCVVPSIAIAITMLSFTFLGDGVRDALDPRLK